MKVRRSVLAGILATAGLLTVAAPSSGAATFEVSPGGSIGWQTPAAT